MRSLVSMTPGWPGEHRAVGKQTLARLSWAREHTSSGWKGTVERVARAVPGGTKESTAMAHIQDLSGRVAVVTGGARGQGEEEARHLSALGADVFIVDVLDQAKTVAAEIGGTFWPGDISEPDTWRGLMRSVMDDRGRLDVLVNNAAICWNRRIEEESAVDLDRMLAVNARGTFLGVQSAIAPMRAGGGGSIINIASIAGVRGLETIGAYSMSKWAIRGLTKVAAAELGRDGIRVNAILPGTINSPMAWAVGVGRERLDDFGHLPIGRVGECSDIAAMVGFLASDASGYITGADFVVDGGATLAIARRDQA
jgi:3alpha(or 20beta)-hydroxysteroid dehydrogenase